MRALTWNIFHGRDWPPDERLQRLSSRVLRRSVHNTTHVQVNRPLLAEFAGVLSSLRWDVALLQEAPPRWLRPLSGALGAHGASALTSRNFGAALRNFVADRNPDVIGANEGGSNQLLVRPPWRIDELRRLTLTLRQERRRMLWARLRGPGGATLCVANMHGSTDHRRAGREVVAAARSACEWSRGDPLIFGGDLNVRPGVAPAPFDELARRFALKRPTAPDAIDHLLAAGLEQTERAHLLDGSVRELPAGGGRVLRLSDHAPVTAAWRME